MRACSTATSAEDNDLVNVANVAGSGRAFFFGGISPLLTRSCTSTHLEKLVEFATSNFSAVRSRSPFFVSASWHSKQYRSRNPRIDGAGWAAITGTATAKSNQAGTKSFMRSTITTLRYSTPGSLRSQRRAALENKPFSFPRLVVRGVSGVEGSASTGATLL